MRFAIVEHFHIARGTLVQSVLHGNVVDETFCRVGSVSSGRHLAADDHADAVAPEAFGKLERIVRGHGARFAGAALHAQVDVNGLESRACNVLDFALQESVEGVVRLEAAARHHRFVRHVHACGHHCDGSLSALFGTHGRQLVLYRQVLGSLDGKLQSHFVERFGKFHAHVESHRALLVVLRHYRLGAFFRCDAQRGIHHVAGKFHVRALYQLERLERNDRQGIFHFSAVRGEASREAHFPLLRHAQCEVAAPFQVHVALSVVAEVAVETCRIADADAQRQVEAALRRRFGLHRLSGVLEAHKFYEAVQPVVHRKRRVL